MFFIKMLLVFLKQLAFAKTVMAISKPGTEKKTQIRELF